MRQNHRMKIKLMVAALLVLPAIAYAQASQEQVNDLVRANDVVSLRDIANKGPKDVYALHAVGYCLLKGGKASEAGQWFQRAMSASSVPSKELVWNASVADLSLAPARAMGVLSRYLQSNPEAGEMYVDLLGVAIERTESAKVMTPKTAIESAKVALSGLVSRLEDGRKDEKKWGSRWVSLDRHKAIQEEIEKSTKKADRLREDLDDAIGDRRDAERYLKSIRPSDYSDGRDYSDAKQRARDRLNDCKRIESEAQAKYDAAVAAIPRPQWTPDLSPVWAGE